MAGAAVTGAFVGGLVGTALGDVAGAIAGTAIDRDKANREDNEAFERRLGSL